MPTEAPRLGWLRGKRKRATGGDAMHRAAIGGTPLPRSSNMTCEHLFAKTLLKGFGDRIQMATIVARTTAQGMLNLPTKSP